MSTESDKDQSKVSWLIKAASIILVATSLIMFFATCWLCYNLVWGDEYQSTVEEPLAVRTEAVADSMTFAESQLFEICGKRVLIEPITDHSVELNFEEQMPGSLESELEGLQGVDFAFSVGNKYTYTVRLAKLADRYRVANRLMLVLHDELCK